MKEHYRTWEKVAEALEISVSMIMMVRSGKRNFSPKVLFRIAQLEKKLGYDVSESAMQLQDASSTINLESETQRADAAEKKLAQLISGLYALLQTVETNHKVPKQ